MSYWMLLIPPLALTAIAVWCDVRTREIPDFLAIGIFLWAVLAWIFRWGGADASAFLGGIAIGAGAGLTMFACFGFGGGDAKLLSALGGVLGVHGMLVMLIVMALAGGVLAVVAAVRGQRTFAYGPAIGAGMLGYFLLVLRGVA